MLMISFLKVFTLSMSSGVTMSFPRKFNPTKLVISFFILLLVKESLIRFLRGLMVRFPKNHAIEKSSFLNESRNLCVSLVIMVSSCVV